MTYVLIFFVLASAYSPAIFGSYLVHDDYLFWRRDLHQLYMLSIAVGRPMAAFVNLLFIKTAHSLAAFNIARCLSVGVLSLCAWLLFQWIRPFVARKKDAFLAACIPFTLPPFQSILDLGTNISIALAAYFAMAAAIIAQEAFGPQANISFRKLGLAAAFLILSLLTYQPSAMIFWTMLALRLLLNEDKKLNWHQLSCFLIVGLLSMALYALLLNFLCKPYAPYLRSLYNPYALRVDVGEKLKWFIREPLINGINLWNIYPNMFWVKISVIFVGSGLLLAAARTKGKNLFNSLGRLTLVVVLTILSFLPNLLNAVPAPFYRTCGGLELILVFIWLWAIRQWLVLLPEHLRPMVLSPILAAALCFGVWRCSENIYLYRELPSQIEFNYVRDVLAAHGLDKYRKIIVVQPANMSRLARYDEFGVFASHYPQDIMGLVKSAAQEAGKFKYFDPSSRPLPISWTDNEQTKDPSALMINMRIPERMYIRLMLKLT